MRNLQNINIRYGSGVPVPVTRWGLSGVGKEMMIADYWQKNGEKFGGLDYLHYLCSDIYINT